MTSRRIPGRYPQQGASDIADRIRQRRGERGLTPLDGTLLHVPPIANGWNQLLGAVRTQGKLPGDIRELLILRVAAHNHAAFEWIHHEHVGRDAGLSTAQLLVVRRTAKPAPPASSPGILTPLQAAALAFADASTKDIRVPDVVFEALKKELNPLAGGNEDTTEDLLVEVAAVVASYNMVSRFLVSLDVAGKSDQAVPVPVDVQEHTIPIPDTSFSLHAVTHSISPTAPYLIFSNSLLTNTSLWSLVYPSLSLAGYNIILFDQRGHGRSSIPDPPKCTMEHLADDIATVLDHLSIAKVHAVIGVSQGGAATLQFGLRHPGRADRIVACDTQAKSPEANIKAWDDRIALAKSDGMATLGKATVGRWFPEGSEWHPSSAAIAGKSGLVLDMIENTPLAGFEAGARALQGYDLLSQGLLQSELKTLLLAGSRDGALPVGLKKLREEWVDAGGDVEFAEVEGSGHLPMLDGAERWLDAVLKFLEG